jgi:site-specific DNA-methyltransferase (adenine-specific)
MAVRIEDAGFEIRDMIAWVYGSGFPKSLDVSKAIDKAAGAEREVVGPNPWNHVRNHSPEAWNGPTRTQDGKYGSTGSGHSDITAPATEAAKQWQGWGTALKPALEPITMARKPFSSTVAANVIQYGTGAINVDGCRVGTETIITAEKKKGSSFTSVGNSAGFNGCNASEHAGRWPANIIHDGSNEAALSLKSGARFFYTAKAGKVDRESENNHPTVKPTMLMAYLCRLITQPGGTILDPFMGSGSTGKAATINGFRFIGIERDPEYHKISEARISNQHEGRLF